MRIAPVPKVAGGVTIGALVAQAIEVAEDYGFDIKPSLAALLTLLATFIVAWLIPDPPGFQPERIGAREITPEPEGADV